MRENIASGSPLEPEIGFSRAVRVGPFLAVAGTAPIGDDGRTVGPGDVSAQTRRCIDIAEREIKSAGLSLDTVIRTRILLTDISRWREAARAHGERFASACHHVRGSQPLHRSGMARGD